MQIDLTAARSSSRGRCTQLHDIVRSAVLAVDQHAHLNRLPLFRLIRRQRIIRRRLGLQRRQAALQHATQLLDTNLLLIAALLLRIALLLAATLLLCAALRSTVDALLIRFHMVSRLNLRSEATTSPRPAVCELRRGVLVILHRTADVDQVAALTVERDKADLAVQQECRIRHAE